MGVDVWLHFLLCTGSLNDDNRKLQWTLDALAMDDPFEREHVVPEDILNCLRCMSSFRCVRCCCFSVVQVAEREVCGRHY